MKVDIVSKGIVYIHLFIVALMAFAGFPQILIYTSLLWGVCGHMSIPLCEEQYDWELSSIWKYKHLVGISIILSIMKLMQT